jgi:hypothetical protein
MSTCAVAAASLAPCPAFPGRSRVLDGMHAVGAFATNRLVLDERDAQTALCARAGAVLARRAAADDDDVVAAAHDGSSLPACSRTMYSAYQSGQSSSR